MKKKSKKRLKKFHFIFIPFGLSVVAILFVVFYFKFDPNLLTKVSFYLDMANPSMRMVALSPGLRQEEVAVSISKKLNWDENKEKEFLSAPSGESTETLEGRYFPKTYIFHKDASPSEIRNTMFGEFENQIKKVKKAPTKAIINERTITTIASIIQREAAGKHDMALISGIIWNRIFAGMKLQMDATLQYPKGNAEDGWWPKVSSKDKNIDSPYNTYLYIGLPPGAIANPSLDAIKAAYNPAKTKCLFYIHAPNRKIYCSETYEGHKENIARYLR